ncbi:hypothetical protein PMAYCL1PPCAC_10519, partial [Pristionchus mayeri]
VMPQVHSTLFANIDVRKLEAVLIPPRVNSAVWRTCRLCADGFFSSIAKLFQLQYHSLASLRNGFGSLCLQLF